MLIRPGPKKSSLVVNVPHLNKPDSDARAIANKRGITDVELETRLRHDEP